MIRRKITDKFLQLSGKFPVITITGPRQSGKTTLVKSLFDSYSYVSLENPERRLMAKTDPQGFLNQFEEKLVIDEIQYVPELLSYIQEIVDNSGIAGQFILTGSQSLMMLDNVSQSLAGRTAILKLLPFSLSELYDSKYFSNDFGYQYWIYNGLYPGIFDKNIDPKDFYPAYFETYIQRDVRQIQNIRDLDLFTNFVRLLAGRTGQILDFTSLSNDTGVSVNTIKGWLAVLQASHIIFQLQPYYKNLNKRMIKSPKIYFTDPGLVSFLLNINSPDQINNHYLKGGLFENLIIAEILKDRYNLGMTPNLYYYRDNNKNEIDLIIESAEKLDIIEIKSGQTFSQNMLKSLIFWDRNFKEIKSERYLIYGGTISQMFQDVNILSWRDITSLLS
jgi:predicted AAA+ superfamily ATPase